jgi:Domain of unknown function (DUF1983)
MAGTLPDELLLARIRRETAAREAAIAALYAALDKATGAMDQKVIAAASKLSNSRVQASAIAGIILRTQVEEGFALAEQVTLLEARLNTAEANALARIEEARIAYVTSTEAFAQQTLTIQAQFNASSAKFTEQITTLSTNTSALATRTTTLESTVNNPTTGVAATAARLTTEETTRATADTALATRATNLESTVNDATTGVAATAARLTTEETTRATADTALATRATNLESTVNSATDGNVALKARIATEETTRASADSALSSSISSVSTTANGKNKTFYQASAPAASASGDLWIDTTGSANAVKRWDGSSWVDTQVASGAIGAAVSTEATARATADGNLSGKYSLKVIAGNIVTGMNISSSTGSGTDVSDITFQGANFKIHNGSTGVTPFSVNTVSNTVTLTNVIVDTLAANISITTPKILGAILKFNGASTICCDTTDGSDVGILRMNGGGADGSGRGGQIDVVGNEYATVAGYGGAVLITPGTADAASVRIRSRDGNDRIHVKSDGVVSFPGEIQVSGALKALGTLAVTGATTLSSTLSIAGTVTCTGDFNLKTSNLGFAQSDGTVNIKMSESWGCSWWRVSDKHHVQTDGVAFVVGKLSNTSLTGNRIYFGSSSVYLYESGGKLYLNDGNGDRALT